MRKPLQRKVELINSKSILSLKSSGSTAPVLVYKGQLSGPSEAVREQLPVLTSITHSNPERTKNETAANSRQMSIVEK